VIDQIVGFIGGLDLCLGRWDTQSHNLSDHIDGRNGECYFPGLDFTNSRTKDFRNVAKYKTCLIDREKQPRMPWHDVGVGIYGDSVQDLSRHFIEYWNHAKIDYEGTKNKKDGSALKPQGSMYSKGFQLSSEYSGLSDSDHDSEEEKQ